MICATTDRGRIMDVVVWLRSLGLNFTIHRNGSNTVARVSMGYPGLETLAIEALCYSVTISGVTV